jgi:hypothetical protein
MIPSQGTGGYAIINTLSENGYTVKLTNGINTFFTIESSGNGINGKRL